MIKIDKTTMVCGGLVGVMLLVALLTFLQAPAASEVIQLPRKGGGTIGLPEGFAIYLLPAVAMAMTVVFAVLPALTPPPADLSRSRKPLAVSAVGCVSVLLAIQLALTARAFGAPVDVARIALAATGALTVVIGNYLPKTRFNYVMGIRTPWTLADERNWDRTHRFAGACLMTAGLIVIAATLLIADTQWAAGAAVTAILAASIASVVYSAVLATGRKTL